MPEPSPSRAVEARGRLLVLAVPQPRRQVVVLVAGEVDRATAPLLRERVVDSLVHRPLSVVVDASDLTFCDLGGLDALVDAVGVVERSGVPVTVRPSAQLAWLTTFVRQLPRTSGQPDRDPAGCPLPRPSRQTT
jgi:anti-anti-sigma factor